MKNIIRKIDRFGAHHLLRAISSAALASPAYFILSFGLLSHLERDLTKLYIFLIKVWILFVSIYTLSERNCLLQSKITRLGICSALF